MSKSTLTIDWECSTKTPASMLQSSISGVWTGVSKGYLILGNKNCHLCGNFYFFLGVIKIEKKIIMCYI